MIAGGPIKCGQLHVRDLCEMADGGEVQLKLPLPQAVVLSLQEKLHQSSLIFYSLETRLLARYGAPCIQEIEGKLSLTVNWFVKRGGRGAKLMIFVNERGSLRVEFTQNIVEGVTRKVDGTDLKLDILLSDGKYVRALRCPDSPHWYIVCKPTHGYHPDKSNSQFIHEFVEMLLMA